jgi:hypothetical protein
MIDGRPDHQRFRQCIEAVLNTIRVRRYGMAIRAFGEMVDLLWRDGNARAAIELEELWNELRSTQSFALLCAYDMSNFAGTSSADGYQAVCAQHAHSLPAEEHQSTEFAAS